MPGAAGSPLVLLLSRVSIVGTTPAACAERHEAARAAAVMAGVCKRAAHVSTRRPASQPLRRPGTCELGAHHHG